MGVLDQLEVQSRARAKRLFGALAAIAAIAAAVGYWHFGRNQAPPPASSSQDAPAPASSLFERGRPGTLRPAVLQQFEGVPSASADPIRLGSEIDGGFYFPQLQGLKGLRGKMLCPSVLGQMKWWMGQYAVDPKVIEQATLEVRYAWNPESGMALSLDGWSDELQPLEKKRNTNILRDLAKLVVPPTHASFFKDYELEFKRRADAILISGKSANPDAQLTAFRKLVYTSGEGAWMEGAGSAARFETLTRYEDIGGRRVIAEIATYVETEAAALRYVVTPIYKDFGGILLPVKFTQVYVDDQGVPRAEPLVLAVLQWEIER